MCFSNGRQRAIPYRIVLRLGSDIRESPIHQSTPSFAHFGGTGGLRPPLKVSYRRYFFLWANHRPRNVCSLLIRDIDPHKFARMWYIWVDSYSRMTNAQFEAVLARLVLYGVVNWGRRRLAVRRSWNWRESAYFYSFEIRKKSSRPWYGFRFQIIMYMMCSTWYRDFIAVKWGKVCHCGHFLGVIDDFWVGICVGRSRNVSLIWTMDVAHRWCFYHI